MSVIIIFYRREKWQPWTLAPYGSYQWYVSLLDIWQTILDHIVQNDPVDAVTIERIFVLCPYQVVTVFKWIIYLCVFLCCILIHISLIFIIATLCYCDEFCDRAINGDCCPDYESYCLGAPDNITLTCFHNGIRFGQFDPPIRDNCNLWWVISVILYFVTSVSSVKWSDFFLSFFNMTKLFFENWVHFSTPYLIRRIIQSLTNHCINKLYSRIVLKCNH